MVSIDWNPDKKKLREFGIVTVIGFLIIAVVAMFLQSVDGIIFKISLVGIVLGIISIIIPKYMMWFYCCWMGIAFVMGNIVGRLLLIIIYYVVCTLLSIIMKLCGRDRLNLKKKSVDSYWQKYDQSLPDKELYEQMF